MKARVNGDATVAGTFLDDNAKKAYAGGGLNLIVNGDPKLSRTYNLTQVVVGTDPDSVLFVVRLVFTHGKGSGPRLWTLTASSISSPHTARSVAMPRW